MEIQHLKPQIDALFDELISKLTSENHGSCVQSCKDYYYICLDKCDGRGNDWGCTNACRAELERCINGCQDGFDSPEDKEMIKEFLDKIESIIKNSN